MPKLSWGDVGTHFYEAGVSKGVLYVDGVGVAWSGLVSVEENSSGGSAKELFLDGVLYHLYSGREKFSATIGAMYSPPEFDACDGSVEIHPGFSATQQRRKLFGFSYRTDIGNDVDGLDHGYKIHIVYNALAAPTQHKHETLRDSVETGVLEWSLTTKPVSVPGSRRTAHLVIDTTRAPDYAVLQLEDILYGTSISTARLPDPDEIAAIFEGVSEFTVTDLGSERFRISGSSFEVSELDTGIWQITQDGVTAIDTDSYQITDS